ncbi:hypothetical protein [Methanoregula sp.]|uniref:hypothetical protein n=1 Tax=Methanoregula sp. TaxID=2052170 RepID=UPI000CB63471|nr:hypothetical protein [Methanoregula sp.]PKG32509.1 MAG: hypothetical protein CW742_07790 [Methanoregula sp.]
MRTSAWVIVVVITLLVAGVFCAGCSDEGAKPGDVTATETVTSAGTTTGAVYAEGDIVRKPASTLSTGLLIIGYDAGTDMYERATIFPFSDGSWGYRLDSKTSMISRATIDRDYTEKVGTVTVSSVRIGAPTITTTVPPTTTKATTAPTATETTASTTAPKINDIDPFIGTAGTTVKITDLKGSNFVSGATVALTKTGETSIDATDVSVSSATKITCKFALPLSTEPGQWNVVITNPDKQAYTSANLFTVYKNTSATATATSTSTTTTTSATSVTISMLTPDQQFIGGIATTLNIDISGSNLGAGNKATLSQGSTTITSTAYGIVGYDARVTMPIPSNAPTGYYKVTILDSNNNVLGFKDKAFNIVG